MPMTKIGLFVQIVSRLCEKPREVSQQLRRGMNMQRVDLSKPELSGFRQGMCVQFHMDMRVECTG